LALLFVPLSLCSLLLSLPTRRSSDLLIKDCVSAPLKIRSPFFSGTIAFLPRGANSCPSRCINSCVAPPRPFPGPLSLTIPSISLAIAPLCVPVEKVGMLILSIKLVTPIFSSTLFNPPVTPLTTLPNFSPILLPSDLIPSTANDAMFLIAFPIRPGSFFAPSTMLSNVSAAYDFTSSNKSEVPSYNFCTPSIAPSFIHKNALTVSSFMPVTFPSTHVANLPNLPVTQLNISIIFWLDSSRIDENLLTTPFFKFVAVVVALVFISPNQPVTALYIFVTRLIALFFHGVKLPVTEFLISVALLVILVHKLENQVVTELYIFVTRLIALSFDVVKLPVTESLISVALEVTLLHMFWKNPV